MKSKKLSRLDLAYRVYEFYTWAKPPSPLSLNDCEMAKIRAQQMFCCFKSDTGHQPIATCSSGGNAQRSDRRNNVHRVAAPGPCHREHSSPPAVVWVLAQPHGIGLSFEDLWRLNGGGWLTLADPAGVLFWSFFPCWNTREVFFHPTASGLLSQANCSNKTHAFSHTRRQEVVILTVMTDLWLWFHTN